MVQAGENAGAARQFMALEQVYGLVEDHRGTGRLDAAEQLLQQNLKARPDEGMAVHFLGLIAHQRGNLTEAIRLVQRANELAPQAALFEAIWARCTGWQDGPTWRSSMANGPWPPARLSGDAQQYRHRLLRAKDFENSLASHRKAIKLNRNFAKAHSNCGNALHALKRFDEAVTCYRRAVALAPDFADGWANLGTSLHHSGYYDEAISTLRRALALEPDNANAHSGLGILLPMRGDLAEGWRNMNGGSNPPKCGCLTVRSVPGRAKASKGVTSISMPSRALATRCSSRAMCRWWRRAPAGSAFACSRAWPGFCGRACRGWRCWATRQSRRRFDFECALMSLPHIFGTRLEAIPQKFPICTPMRATRRAGARGWRICRD